MEFSSASDWCESLSRMTVAEPNAVWHDERYPMAAVRGSDPILVIAQLMLNAVLAIEAMCSVQSFMYITKAAAIFAVKALYKITKKTPSG